MDELVNLIVSEDHPEVIALTEHKLNDSTELEGCMKVLKAALDAKTSAAPSSATKFDYAVYASFCSASVKKGYSGTLALVRKHLKGEKSG